MKLSKIAVNSAAIENGRWVDVDHFMPGVRLKVRGFEGADYLRLQAKLTAETPRADRLKGADSPLMRELSTRLLVDAILSDWEGLENEDGTPLAYSKAKATEILANRDLLVFRKAVEWAANVVGDDEIADAEDVAKN
jgi:hypothetical protein